MQQSPKGIILYVEDNPDNRSLVRRVLSAEGFTVLEAMDAGHALNMLNENQNIDLILMDINMPDVDGYSLTSRIKSMPLYSGIPVIAVTANVMRGDREKSIQAGCDGYIQKPIDVDTIAQQVEKYISRSSDV